MTSPFLSSITNHHKYRPAAIPRSKDTGRSPIVPREEPPQFNCLIFPNLVNLGALYDFTSAARTQKPGEQPSTRKFRSDKRQAKVACRVNHVCARYALILTDTLRIAMASTDIETLLGELSLEEKVSLLSGADIWQTQEVSRLGIGSIKVLDLHILTAPS